MFLISFLQRNLNYQINFLKGNRKLLDRPISKTALPAKESTFYVIGGLNDWQIDSSIL